MHYLPLSLLTEHVIFHTCGSNSLTVVLSVQIKGVCGCGWWMAAASAVRYCNSCSAEYGEGHKTCKSCDTHPMLFIHCPHSDWRGLYTNWYTCHRPSCVACGGKMEEETDAKLEREREKKTRSFQDTEHGHHTACSLSQLQHEAMQASEILCLLVGAVMCSGTSVAGYGLRMSLCCFTRQDRVAVNCSLYGRRSRLH